MAGLAIAGAAFVAKQAVQTYVKLSASGSIFNASKAFYKVGGSRHGEWGYTLHGVTSVSMESRERFRGGGMRIAWGVTIASMTHSYRMDFRRFPGRQLYCSSASEQMKFPGLAGAVQLRQAGSSHRSR